MIKIAQKQSLFQRIGHAVFDGLPDKSYLRLKYRYTMHKKLDLNNPVTYTAKLQWLKLYDHNLAYPGMVDKCEAKKYAAGIIGDEYIIPTLGVWNTAEEIDFDALPDRFAIKCTHDSGSVMICRDKSAFDTEKAREHLKKALQKDGFTEGREWPYKNVTPRVIAEAFMEDETDGELRDYKFFCFSGEPKALYITQGRGANTQTVADFFDMDFRHLPFTIDHDTAEVPPHKPLNFDLMKKLAAELSQGIPHVRVDFYEVNGRVYFGEMTFFHCCGFSPFHPEEWDERFGSWIRLPEKTNG